MNIFGNMPLSNTHKSLKKCTNTWPLFTRLTKFRTTSLCVLIPCIPLLQLPSNTN